MEAWRDDESQKRGRESQWMEMLIFWGKGGSFPVRAHSVLWLYDYTLGVINEIVGGSVQ